MSRPKTGSRVVRMSFTMEREIATRFRLAARSSHRNKSAMFREVFERWWQAKVDAKGRDGE